MMLRMSFVALLFCLQTVLVFNVADAYYLKANCTEEIAYDCLCGDDQQYCGFNGICDEEVCNYEQVVSNYTIPFYMNCSEGESECICGVAQQYCGFNVTCDEEVCNYAQVIDNYTIPFNMNCSEGESECICGLSYCPGVCMSGVCGDYAPPSIDECTRDYQGYCLCEDNDLCLNGENCIEGVCYDTGLTDGPAKVYGACDKSREYFCYCGDNGTLCMGAERCNGSQCQ